MSSVSPSVWLAVLSTAHVLLSQDTDPSVWVASWASSPPPARAALGLETHLGELVINHYKPSSTTQLPYRTCTLVRTSWVSLRP